MRRIICFLALSGIIGCSDPNAPPPLYPVEGTLVVGGKPLPNIDVQLAPVDLASKARPGIGKTDAEGKFVIRTNGDKGAISGKYKVVLSTGSAKEGQESIEEAMKKTGEMIERMKQGTAGPAPSNDAFPKEWASANTSPKEVEVGNQPVTIKIEI